MEKHERGFPPATEGAHLNAAAQDSSIISQIRVLVTKELEDGRDNPNTILMGIDTYLRFSDEVDVVHTIVEFEGKRVYTIVESDNGLVVCYIPYE